MITLKILILTFISSLSSVIMYANVHNSIFSEHSYNNNTIDSKKKTILSFSSIPEDVIMNIPDTLDTYSKLSQTIGEYKIKKIVLDAGHGGKDHGCSGSKSKEKHIALNIALKLGERISRNYPQIEVIYTRKTDVFIPLHERAEIANTSDADLFISIHCNYVGTHTVHGTETFVMGLHRAKENLDVAKRENSVIELEDNYEHHYDGYDPNSSEGHILLSMYQNAHLEQSIALAHAIEESFKNDSKRHSRGVKQAGFLVLRRTTMPSVLVETGFLSNKNEEAYLLSEKGQNSAADNMLTAFRTYIKTYAPATERHRKVTDLGTDTKTYYSVQVTAVGTALKNNHPIFKAVKDIYMIKTNDFTKYYSGPFETKEAAIGEKERLISLNYKDAFIITHENVYKQ